MKPETRQLLTQMFQELSPKDRVAIAKAVKAELQQVTDPKEYSDAAVIRRVKKHFASLFFLNEYGDAADTTIEARLRRHLSVVRYMQQDESL